MESKSDGIRSIYNFFFFLKFSVSIVLGIPSAKREFQSYLVGTLRNLIDSMNEYERNDTLIVVLIAETDMDYVVHLAHQIEIE